MEADKRKQLRSLLIELKTDIAGKLGDLVNTTEKIEALKACDLVVMYLGFDGAILAKDDDS